MTQPPLASARFRGQDVTRKRVAALDFASSGFFEPFSRTLVGLQLWHDNVLDAGCLPTV